MNVHTFIGEIRMFAGEVLPEGWAFCDGRLLTIDDNFILYSLIGDTFWNQYDGVHFALPDLRGRVPIHRGAVAGKVQVGLAEKKGAEKAVLTAAHVPPHVHTVFGVTGSATDTQPRSDFFMATPPGFAYTTTEAIDKRVTMNAESIGKTGTSGYEISTVQPYQAINFIIALDGEIPPRD